MEGKWMKDEDVTKKKHNLKTGISISETETRQNKTYELWVKISEQVAWTPHENPF